MGADPPIENLHLSTEQLTAMLALVRVGLTVVELTDPDDPETWLIRAANPAASQAVRAQTSQLVGQPFLLAFPSLRETTYIDWYRDVHATGIERELPELRFGDDEIPTAAFQVWLSPLPGGCVLGQHVNMTLQRQAEARLRQLSATLDERVDDRTAQLQASRLMISEIAYAVAHDLRTPLRHMMLLADLVDPEHPDLDDLANIVAAGQLMRERLDALLDFADAEQGVEVVPFDASTEVLAVLDHFSGLIKATGAKVDFVAASLPVSACRDALRCALVQFVANALRYHLPGAVPRVRIEVALRGEQLVVQVTDEGIGIAFEHHEAIFQAFYRSDDRRVAHGVGVGLAQCRVAVTAAGGSVGVCSVPGHGATFHAYLPARPATLG
ncbi:MAG: HAMP domain-containing histidine kinase [Myxococcales bacterium]|nr:HAMP domain-containing histidine kinase [Myxococcales bacterium]